MKTFRQYIVNVLIAFDQLLNTFHVSWEDGKPRLVVNEHVNMGLYFDHGCKNLVFHHNVIWNATDYGMINNQYGNYLLYYNNTVSDAKWSYRSTWAAAQAKDLYGCQLINNVGTSEMTTNGKGLLTSHNTWHFEGLLDKKFPKPGTAPIR